MSEASKIKLLSDYLTWLSHELRNSVGVADGVIGDKLSGFAIKDNDFQDAKHALERIKLLLDGMKVVDDALGSESEGGLAETIGRVVGK